MANKIGKGCAMLLFFGSGCAVMAIGCAGLIGAGWWFISDDESEELATNDEPDACDPDAEVTEEVTVVDQDVVFFNPQWLTITYWLGEDPTTDDEPGTSDATEPDAPSAPLVAAAGVKAFGNAFPAPGKSGAMAPTSAVILGDVPGSARSSAGEVETYWIQGTKPDPENDARQDSRGKLLNPDDIRNVVGTRKSWTAIPGYSGVYGKCVVIQDEDGKSPAGCSRAVRVAQL